MVHRNPREVPFIAKNFAASLNDSSYPSQIRKYCEKFLDKGEEVEHIVTQMTAYTKNLMKIARFYYLGEDMAMLAMRRVREGKKRLLPEEFAAIMPPFGSGFMIFENTLQSEDHPEYKHSSAIVWHQGVSVYNIQYFSQGTRWSHPLKFMKFDMVGTDRHTEVYEVDETQALRLAWLAEIFHMMGETIADVSEDQTPYPIKFPGRPKLPEKISVIRLRKAKKEIQFPGTGRQLTYRTRTRGHPRMQRYGPGLSLVRKIWINDYERGPEGAPFFEPTKVTSLER
jgi:hypothetical protein